MVAASRRLVDVYVEHRIIATCPVECMAAEAASGEQPASVTLAKQMLKDDGVLTDEQLARAAFRVRSHD